jgi:hypothetical protein
MFSALTQSYFVEIVTIGKFTSGSLSFGNELKENIHITNITKAKR